MAFKTDIEIAQETQMQPILEVAKTAGIDEKYLEQYGKYKAKVSARGKNKGKLILVTAINPTNFSTRIFIPFYMWISCYLCKC